MSEGDVNNKATSPSSPKRSPPSPFPNHLVPSPLITKRNRTNSTCEKILRTKDCYGTINNFCLEKACGLITPDDGGEDIFVHVSDIEDEYIPLPGDRVKYHLCPIPPKFEKYQAVHVHIVCLKPEVHKRWGSHC